MKDENGIIGMFDDPLGAQRRSSSFILPHSSFL